jgi:hypothetical protein
MMDRLSILLTLATGAVTTGALVIAVLSLGWVAWGPILGAPCSASSRLAVGLLDLAPDQAAGSELRPHAAPDSIVPDPDEREV